MNFRTIRESVIAILEQYSQGEFTVIGAQKRGKNAEETLDELRLVEVYYSNGTFPRSAGSLHGPNKHEIRIRIDMTVSKASEGEVDVIQNPSSTAAEVAAALRSMKESDYLADISLDELFEVIYQILMDARNSDLGLPKGFVASRWCSDLNKDEPIERGNYTILTGNMILTCSTSEPVEGYKGSEEGGTLDVNLELETDPTGKAGVETGE